MKILLFIVVFLLVGGFFIISNENIRMNSSENVDHFLSLYYSWLDGIIGNAKIVSGYVVRMEWLPSDKSK